MRFPGGKKKAITLSYDDGVKADKKLAEILNRYGVKCTFNINDAFIGSEPYLNQEEIEEYLLGSGHEVANHGNCHIAPGIASVKDGLHDMLEGRRRLENRFSRMIKGMAYPDSGIEHTLLTGYKDIKTYLEMLGIVYGRTAFHDNHEFRMPTDWHKWVPTCHHNHPDLFQWLDRFKAFDNDTCYWSERDPKLFYLWGHSYEFDNDNNWDVIEEFCKRATDSDDIWFATNMEIYEYTKAYESLEFNFDNTMVFNPTLYDIYFRDEEKDYVVKSGERMKLA